MDTEKMLKVLKTYPMLKQFVELLGSEVSAHIGGLSSDPVDRDKGERVVGELTPGESQLFSAFFNELAATKKRIHNFPDDKDLEMKLREEDARITQWDDLKRFLWSLIHQRLALPYTAHGFAVRNDKDVVVIPFDCGCGDGLKCFAVQDGLIDPDTGEMSQNFEEKIEDALILMDLESDTHKDV